MHRWDSHISVVRMIAHLEAVWQWGPIEWRRFKGTAKLFGEFKELAVQEKAKLVLPGPSGASTGQQRKAMSAEDISVLIRAAAAHVLGSAVADDVPLTGAGLDSLGG